jgi:thiol-disulfide isomerase/thioredoxin
MKYFFSILFLSLCLNTFSQNPENNKAPYLQVQIIPPFKIYDYDSTLYSKSDLKKGTVLIVYFSPDCGHCQMETDSIISKINDLKKLQIIMITGRYHEDMKAFIDKYKLLQFKNIKVGNERTGFLQSFYQIEFTPFSALYSKKGKLLTVFEKGIDYEKLKNLIH